MIDYYCDDDAGNIDISKCKEVKMKKLISHKVIYQLLLY